MSLKDFNRSFKEQWNVLPVDYENSDKGTLDMLLSNVIKSMGNSTDWEKYTKSFEDCIEQVFPDDPWWENVGLDIRLDLFNTQDPNVTKQHILDSIIEPLAYTEQSVEDSTEVTESLDHPGEINYKGYIIKFNRDGRANILDKDFKVIRTDIGSEEEGREYIDSLTEGVIGDKLSSIGSNIGKNLSNWGSSIGNKLDSTVTKVADKVSNVANKVSNTANNIKNNQNTTTTTNNKKSNTQQKVKVNNKFTPSNNSNDPYWKLNYKQGTQTYTVYGRGADKNTAINDAKHFGAMPPSATVTQATKVKGLNSTKDSKLDKLHTTQGSTSKFTQDNVNNIITSSLKESNNLRTLEIYEMMDAIDTAYDIIIDDYITQLLVRNGASSNDNSVDGFFSTMSDEQIKNVYNELRKYVIDKLAKEEIYRKSDINDLVDVFKITKKVIYESKKQLKESLEVKQEVDFNDLLDKCWGQAVTNLKEIEDAGYEDELMDYLEKFSQGNPIDLTDLNDLLAYDWEYVFESIGMPSPYEETLKESSSYSKSELLSAVKDMYGMSTAEAMNWIKSADEQSKQEIVRGFKKNAKDSFLVDSVEDEEVDTEDVVLIMENDGDLYRRSILPVINNLKRKKRRGVYDEELAKKAFLNVVNYFLSTPQFIKQYGYTKHNVSVSNRKEIAEYLLDDFMEEIDYEELQEDTVKTKNGKWTNRGDDGEEHGEFKTKKEADAQRKAMYAQGFRG